MNAENPLANLRDIHLPEQISWWPLAPGWWLLLVLLLALLLWLGIKLRQRYQFRQTYRLCQSELSNIDATYQANKDSRKLISDYSQLMRRLLIHRLGRQGVANLNGSQVIDLLEEYSLTENMDDEVKALLIDGPYRKRLEIDNYEQIIQSLDGTLLKLSLLNVGRRNHA